MLSERKGAPSGVYVITPDWTDTDRLLSAVDGALRGGAGAVQYRNKTAAPALRSVQAGALARVVQAAGLPFFVDNDLALAVEIGADGLHIGRDDGDVDEVRARLPTAMRLGVSCYGDLGRVARAIRAGADYVAIGVMYASRTKVGAPSVPIGLIDAARRMGARVVASGGINAETIAQVAAAGAAAAGVVSAVFDESDPARATATLAERFAIGAGSR